MREILFRGKRADNGEWVCGYYSNLGSCSRITKEKVTTGEMGRIIECENIEVLPETVGQYTGLTDKNGKKIFEGDICLIHTSIVYQRGVVSYNPKTANFDIKGNGFVTDFYNYFGSDCEVIGNIHDNPELLKGGENNETPH